MNIARIIQLFKQPELLDRETLYELRCLLERYPYFAAVRMLYLHNLYLLNDRSFRSELARMAFSLNDRSLLFQEIEGTRYAILPDQAKLLPEETGKSLQGESPSGQPASSDRTVDLINRFLAQQPDTSFSSLGYDGVAGQSPLLFPEIEGQEAPSKGHGELGEDSGGHIGESAQPVRDLEDSGDEKTLSRPSLPDTPPQPSSDGNETLDGLDESYFTETLAKIYVKQGRYEKALEIIKTISLKNPKKNAYFADQIRFLRKLIINSSK